MDRNTDRYAAWFLTVSAAGLDRDGLQAAALRSHTQHHAAMLVLGFGRSDVTFSGRYPDAGWYVCPLLAVTARSKTEFVLTQHDYSLRFPS